MNFLQTFLESFMSVGVILISTNLVQSLTKRSNFEEFKRFLSYFFPRIAGLLKERLLKKETNYFRDLFWKSVGARIKSGKRRGDLIDVLLELKHSKEKDEIFGKFLEKSSFYPLKFFFFKLPISSRF